MLRVCWLAKRTFSSRNLLKLTERQSFIANMYPREKGPDIAAYLEGKKRTIYAGFDPTASSLHIGNLLVIMGLLHAQKVGHQAIALIGGFTARIGDPSGKSEERTALPLEEIQRNVNSIEKNLKSIFKNFQDIHGVDEVPLVVNNADWYHGMDIMDFHANYGRHFRLAKMLSKETVKQRLEATKADPQGGMSHNEFFYQAFQSYDWLHLSRAYECYVQLGGHDQMGNISAGHDFIKRVTGKQAYGLLLPLITTETGQKLGKSESNAAVWLAPHLTSSFDFYQSFIRTPDSLVEKMLHYFTFLPVNEIQDLMKVHQKHPDHREPQLKLAKEVTNLVHGQRGLDLAEKTTQILYGKNDQDILKTLRALSKEDLKSLFPAASYSRQIYQPGLTVLDLAMKIRLFKNEKSAQTIIQGGGFQINQVKRTNIDEMIIPGDHILSNNCSLVRIGKKKFVIVDWYQ